MASNDTARANSPTLPQPDQPVTDDTDEEFESEESFFPEEEGGEVTGIDLNKMQKYQEIVANAKMVAWSNFGKELYDFFVEEFSFELTKDITSKILKFAEATCFIIRKTNCDARIDMQEKRVAEAKAKLAQHKTKDSYGAKRVIKMQEKLDRYKTRKGGNGTGFLVGPEKLKVITNNHVLMEKEEKGAQVIFDFVEDGNRENCRIFGVKKIVSASPPTNDSDDTGSYDYSYLELDVSVEEDKEFLKERWVLADQTKRIQRASVGRREEDPKIPMLMFSHPHGLAQRLSLDYFPENIENESKKIKHDLPTTRGCSGAALIYPNGGFIPRNIYPFGDPATFNSWQVAFVHYCHGNAFLMQTIGADIRENRS